MAVDFVNLQRLCWYFVRWQSQWLSVAVATIILMMLPMKMWHNRNLVPVPWSTGYVYEATPLDLILLHRHSLAVPWQPIRILVVFRLLGLDRPRQLCELVRRTAEDTKGKYLNIEYIWIVSDIKFKILY